MKRLVSIRLLLVMMILGLFVFPAATYAQNGNDARALVGRTQDDVRRASSYANTNRKERERYDNALKRLSTFDRHLTKGKFDKGKLNQVVDDLKNILDHNTLSTNDRDALMQDIAQLRQLRSTRGGSY